jgi:N-acetylneuraminic acid mutarotase
MILGSMAGQRVWSSFATHNNRLYVFGGFADYSTLDLATVEVYNPVRNTWSAAADMPGKRYANNGAAVIGSNIYVSGGFYYPAILTGSFFRYNVNSNTWTTLPDMPSSAAGGCGATAAIGATVASTELFVYTGCTPRYSTVLHRYTPASGTWTQLASAPERHAYPASVVISGKLYLIGGIKDDANIPSAAVHIYDPATDSWSSGPSMPTARWASTAQVVGTRLIVAGGAQAALGPALSIVEILDLNTMTWSSAPSMQVARQGAFSASLYDRIYVGGGSNNAQSYFSSLESLRH